MNLIHSEKFADWARGHMVCRADGVDDRFALTFDDGPSPTATPRVLDLLAGAGARATFFTLAHNVRRAPGLGLHLLSGDGRLGICLMRGQTAIDFLVLVLREGAAAICW